MPTLTPYQPSDHAVLLAIFDANTPKFFAPRERALFERFLDDPEGDFRVLRDEEGETIGCGGVIVDAKGEAGLNWGMIVPSHQGTGYGWWMALERLSWIAAMPEARTVVFDTSQETVGFYTRLGFHVVSVEQDGYGPGLHRHELTMEVNDAFRKRFGGSPTLREPRSMRV